MVDDGTFFNTKQVALQQIFKTEQNRWPSGQTRGHFEFSLATNLC